MAIQVIRIKPIHKLGSAKKRQTLYQKTMKILFFLLLLFPNFILHGQESKKWIIDSKTGLGISFATIKVLNTTKGVIAFEKGDFSLEFASTDTIQISCINYYTKKIIGNEMTDTILLDRNIKTLDDVMVKSRSFINTTFIGDDFKNLEVVKFNSFAANKDKTEYAKKIKLVESDNLYKLKSIQLGVNKINCWGSLLIHIYAENKENGLPGEELLRKVVSVSKENTRKSKATFDISNENVVLPARTACFFVGVEWLQSRESSNCITTLLMKKSSETNFYYRSLQSKFYNWNYLDDNIANNTNVPFKSGICISLGVDVFKE